MKDIFFSVIIPCYNSSEQYITESVNSVLNQTYTNFEIIIVDDGSLADCTEILKKLAASDKRIKLITQENQGVSVARNNGINNAKGDFIAFLDDDDVLTPDFLERANYFQKMTDADFVIGNIALTLDREITDNIRFRTNEYKLFLDKDVEALKKKFIGKSDVKIGTPYVGRGPVARIIRSDIVKNTYFCTDLVIGEDLVWNLELLSKCRRVCMVNDLWYWYWRNPKSATHRANSEMYEILIKQLTKIEECINLDDMDTYIEYGIRVYEGLYLIWDCLLRRKEIEKSIRKSVNFKVYNDSMWKIVTSEKFIKNAPVKYKIFGVLFKMRLLFEFLNLRRCIFGR